MRLKEWLNEDYLDRKCIERLRRQYAAAKPFPHLALHDLLRPAKIKQLETSFRRLGMRRKEADLFSFLQSDDLYTVNDRTIKEFLKLLQSREFTSLINTISDVKTTAGKVDASAFTYERGDHLLCHDDGISSRRIAYIFYLNTLAAGQGGALTLFASNKEDEPVKAAKRLQPRRNTLAIFTVSRRSHHQVDEVLSASRKTITGWFHA